MKKITLLFLFLIGSITSSFGQFTEGFESGIPATWTVINGGDANTFIANTYTPHGGTGDVSIIYTTPTAHDDYLVTPAITVTAGTSDRISFWARSRDIDFAEVFDVKLSTTTATAAAFTVTLASGVAPASGTAFYQYSYDLSAYVGQTVYVSIYSQTADMFVLDLDDFVNDTPPLVVPGCAANPVSTPNATCGNFASTISWDAAATATGYNLTVGTTSGGTDIVNNVDVGAVLTYNLPTQTPGTTYYWKVVPYNGVGPAVGCTENSYTTFATGCYCPSLPTSNDNLGVTNVLLGSTNVPNGDVTYVDNTATVVTFAQGLSANTQITFATGYTYDTNIWIDFNDDFDFDDAGELVQTGIASTATNPTTLDASFIMPVTAALGQHRMRIGTADDGQVPPAPCYSGAYGVTLDFTVNIIVAPTDLPDYANLQWPPTATATQLGAGADIYGQVYEAGLTNPAGQAAGINAWVGVSPIGSNTNPNTWTNWTVATYNVDFGNNDEYKATIGSALAPGTYYYATRFQLNGGAYVYGGIDASNNGNFWDGTTYNSGVLTVNPPPPPANDACAGAIALIPGGVFADGAVTGTVFNATNDAVVTPSCAYTLVQNSDVWYSFVVPASGNITIETQAAVSNSLTDTTVGVYSGTCGALTEVGCDDDGGTGLLSLVVLTGLTAGDTLYVGVWKWGTTAPSATVNQFKVSAYDASLGNSSFDNSNFAFYPNPVKNILNLSYNQEISSVDVFNLLGQRVSSNKINANSAQVDMSNLSRGAYMVKVTSNDQVKTIKVIKE